MMTTMDRRYKSAPRRYTFGVYGLTEWQALIPVGQAKLRIPFTGGMLSAYGLSPAKFSTTDASLARLIRDCEYFKTGRIREL